MFIRTKIIATIGPASADIGVIRRLAQAGCDIFRINFSHGSYEQHERVLANVRQVERELGEPLAVLGDLCGPKIRVSPLASDSAVLVEGANIAIQREPIAGTAERISSTLPELIDEARVGEPILLDDGKLRLEVVECRPPKEIICRVVQGGTLRSGKGINLPRTQLTLAAMTPKDHADARWIAAREFDYVALSFVRRASDVEELRSVLRSAGSDARIIAKIEKPAALDNIDSIIATADGIMVARGDLGVEMDLPAVPVAQKRIAAVCGAAGKPCIIATQMLETMTENPSPTRAEVSDVANAVMDCADAVMLSGETAVGKHPVESVAMMNRIVSQMQAYHDEQCMVDCVDPAPGRAGLAVVAAVRAILNHEPVAAVAVYTLTGATALLMAKSRLPRPVLAISSSRAAMRRTCLYYGVMSVEAPQPEHTRDVLAVAARSAVAAGLARAGDKIVVVSGRPLGEPGRANTIVIHTVPDDVN